MECDVLEHYLELFNPLFYVVHAAVGHASALRFQQHSFRANVNLFPIAMFGKQFHVETLVAIFFRRVDKIVDASRLLLEHIGQERVDA